LLRHLCLTCLKKAAAPPLSLLNFRRIEKQDADFNKKRANEPIFALLLLIWREKVGREVNDLKVIRYDLEERYFIAVLA